MAGAMVSRMFTVKLHPLVLPLSSIDPQLTVVTPGANKDPGAGTQVRVGVESQASLVVTLKLPTFPDGPLHSSTMFVEHVIEGATVSRTCTVKLQVLVLA